MVLVEGNGQQYWQPCKGQRWKAKSVQAARALQVIQLALSALLGKQPTWEWPREPVHMQMLKCEPGLLAAPM